MRTTLIATTLLLIAITAAGCSSSSSTRGGNGKNSPHGSKDAGATPGSGGPDSGAPGPILHIESGTAGAVHITPASADLVVNPATGMVEPVQFKVTGNPGGSYTWVVSNPALGYIDENGLFTPTGRVGGMGQVQIVVDGMVVASVPIKIGRAHV